MFLLDRKTLACVAGLGLAWVAMDAQAIITRPGDVTPFTPPDAVIGAAFRNPSESVNSGSAVAIGPEHALVTRHQGGSLGNIRLTFDGVTYRAAEITAAPGDQDFRIVRLETLDGQPAQLTDYVSVYTGRQELGKNVVLGGHGLGRGDAILRGNTVIGYEWGDTYDLRWGANVVSNTQNNAQIDFGNFVGQNDAILADFSTPSRGVAGEASITLGDSGGGWFVFEDNQWFVAGLTQAVDNFNEAIFSPSETLAAVRLSSYSTFINSSILDLGDFDGSGDITNSDIQPFLLALNDPTDYTNQYGLDGDIVGDFNGDGVLSDGDIGGFVQRLTGNNFESPASLLFASTVPEPRTAALLGFAGLALLRRRRPAG